MCARSTKGGQPSFAGHRSGATRDQAPRFRVNSACIRKKDDECNGDVTPNDLWHHVSAKKRLIVVERALPCMACVNNAISPAASVQFSAARSMTHMVP